MKRQAFQLINIVAVLLLITSCSDFLTTDPRSNQTIDQFYQNEKEAQIAVDGSYNWIGLQFGNVAYGESPSFMLEYPTGQSYFSKGQQSLINPDLEKLNYWNRGYVDNWWQGSYYGIEACNLALDGMSKLPETDNLKRLKGETYFLRAYYYFNLVRIFGDIPLKLSKTERPSDGMLPKSPILDIYTRAIIPGLEEAEKCNIPNEPSFGRISAQAVKALQAQVYLTMAGAPLNQTDKYPLAAQKAQEVIASQKFALFQSQGKTTWFEKLRSKTYDNQGEYVLMANYGSSPAPRQYYSILLAPAGNFDLVGIGGFGSLMPQLGFVQSYDPIDLRGKEKGFFFSSYPSANDSTKILSFENSIYKFFEPTLQGSGGWSEKSLPLIRYAEILLTYAEAQAQSGAVDAQAIDAVNQIRRRAGLAALTHDITSSSQKFIEEVRKQRIFELCYEGVAFFDMIRTQQAWSFETKSFVPLNGYKLPSGAVFDVTKHSYFPIPLREIQINPLLGE